MTPTFLRAMLWKEIRELAGFWIVLLAVGILIQVFLLSPLLPDEFERPKPVEVIPIGSVLAGLFLIGCAGAQFAAERENGTYAFLRALPTGASGVFFVKLAVAILGSLLITAVLTAPAAWMAYSAGNVEIPQALLAVLVFEIIALEVFFWILPFSLLGSRPFVAIALGVLCGLSLPWIVWPWATIACLGDSLPAAACSRGVFLLIVIWFDIWLAGRWFRAKERGGGAPVGSMDDVFYPVVVPGVVWSPAPTAWSVALRLVWQQTREAFSHWRYASLIAVAAAAVVFLTRVIGHSDAEMRALLGTLWLALFLLVPVLGGLVFRVDQSKERFRFLAEHGLSPQLLWITRQISSFLFVSAVVAFLCGAALLTAWLSSPRWNHLERLFDTPGFFEQLSIFAAGLLAAYAIGQFCSMAIRNPLIAAFSAVGLSVLAFAAASLFHFFHVNEFLLAACWIVSLFVASYVGTDAWMTERRTWRTRGTTALVLLIPTLLLFVGTAFYRAYELPSVAVDIRPEQLVPEVTAQDRANGRKYEAVFEKIPPRKENETYEAWQERTRDAVSEHLDEVLAIAGPAATPWYEAEGDYFKEVPQLAVHEKLRSAGSLGLALSDEAERLTEEGKYDEALRCMLAKFRLDRYFTRSSCGTFDTAAHCKDWRRIRRLAFESDWDAARLLDIRDELYSFGDARLSLAAAVRQRFLRYQWLVDTDRGNPDRDVVTRIAAWLPWERERARRQLCIIAQGQLRLAKEYDANVQNNGLLNPPMFLGENNIRVSNDSLEFQEGELTCLPDDALINHVAQTQRQLYAPEVERRATRLMLTLLAWEREEGEYPKRLSELVEGAMIDALPDITFSGGGYFHYLPGGLEEAVHLTMSWSPSPGENDSVSWEIPAKTPLLWVWPYVLPGMSYSVELRPADKEKSLELQRYLERDVAAMGMGGGMGMGMEGGPGMDAGMGMGPGMEGGMGGGMGMGPGGGMGGPGMGGGMEAPPMPGVGVPEWNPPRKDPLPPFLRRLIELEIKWTGEQALVIPLGPVKVIEQEGEVETR